MLLMRRENFWCNKYRIDYKPFSGTSLDEIRIDYAKWLILINFFDLEVSARTVAAGSDICILRHCTRLM